LPTAPDPKEKAAAAGIFFESTRFFPNPNPYKSKRNHYEF